MNNVASVMEETQETSSCGARGSAPATVSLLLHVLPLIPSLYPVIMGHPFRILQSIHIYKPSQRLPPGLYGATFGSGTIVGQCTCCCPVSHCEVTW